MEFNDANAKLQIEVSELRGKLVAAEDKICRQNEKNESLQKEVALYDMQAKNALRGIVIALIHYSYVHSNRTNIFFV